jgi:hypothetical protein
MAMPKSEMMSLRMPRSIAERLERAARRAGQPRSSLVQRYVDEGLRRDRHPRVTFKDGPTGRRAALVGGPDIWELVSFVDDLDARGERAVEQAARSMVLSIEDVRAGLAYAAEFSDEIRERIALNDEMAAESEAAWQAQQDLLA